MLNLVANSVELARAAVAELLTLLDGRIDASGAGRRAVHPVDRRTDGPQRAR